MPEPLKRVVLSKMARVNTPNASGVPPPMLHSHLVALRHKLREYVLEQLKWGTAEARVGLRGSSRSPMGALVQPALGLFPGTGWPAWLLVRSTI